MHTASIQGVIKPAENHDANMPPILPLIIGMAVILVIASLRRLSSRHF